MLITKPDAVWLGKLIVVIEFIYQEYPELFSKEDEEILLITTDLVNSLNKPGDNR